MEYQEKQNRYHQLTRQLSLHHMGESLELTGRIIAKNKSVFLLFLLFIAIAEVVMFIRGLIVFDLTQTRRILYMVSYVLLFTASLLALPFVFRVKESSMKSMVDMGVVLHIFSFFIVCWSVLISFLDMLHGRNVPLVYLTIIMTMGCIVVIHPTVYLGLIAFSFVSLVELCHLAGSTALSSTGDTWNIVVFLVMSFLVALRQHRVLRNEDKTRKGLEKLTITDTLTGLENETSYYRLQDEMEKRIAEEKEEPFAIVMMDLNNVKATNDQWGHRFGCHLIVTVGKMLPKIFLTSRLFHIGGDEFVAIVFGEDFIHLKERLALLQERLAYSTTTLEDHELILSVAHGAAHWEKGLSFKDVVQCADEFMYARKVSMKQEYGFTAR